MTDLPSAAISTVAPAKLNLYLHLLGRRADGHHIIDSLVVFANAGDRLAVRKDGGLSLMLAGPFGEAVPAGDNNLALRAARLLAGAAGRPAAALIRLEKRLPVAAGIGGGSADAAAALRVLARLWRVPNAATLCRRIAPKLGADVPVCLSGAPSFMGGIGERVSAAPALPRLWSVLVNPGVPVATPLVFAAFARACAPFGTPGRFRRAPADADALAALLRERQNDLSDAAIALAPPIARALAALNAQQHALIARMSGSGATCFALFATEHRARAAAAAIRRAEPAWWVVAAEILRRPPAIVIDRTGASEA